jgi:type I restriction-modification system DNA methylase subunit
MSLFQNSVLNKYLKGLETEKVKEAYEKFTRHFHNPEIQENIRNSKEEQYQGEFLIDLFVNVLGYIKNPTPEFNLTTELKNIKDSKKTDGAILNGEKALAVIELKGTNTTDLSKVETQAFGYKNNQPGCNYVITSNFEKLRFYIDNAVDFEEFNLFQLTKERFDILWLCLSSDYLLKNIPKKIKDESLTQEENITKKLYNDYSGFRNEIFDSILKENPEYDKLTLFKKTQKLLDRFLFIFFAEDRLLLPPNSIRSIVNQWTDLRDKYDEYFPLYDRFKKYFGYMNSGHKGQQHDIFAYNGGLFTTDEILDNIKINDDILFKHTVNLSNYDFESDVSVNILGHIFEHSLNDIEAIQSEIEGISTDQSKSKRKKDGVFYTPKYITKYIVENTIGKLCGEKKIELDIQEAEYEKDRKGRQKATLKKLTQKLEDYRKWLLQITICDPACGSGAFLNQALEFLIAEHRYIDELQAKLFGDAMILSEVENSILENNLFGVDINEESVEIAKLSLWLRTAQKGRKLTILNNNIKCGNSLIDDPNVAGDKAFNWQNEFPKIFQKGGFDVVIGNPPYVFTRTGEFMEESKNYILDYVLENSISTTSKGLNIQKGKINLFAIFIIKAIEILNEKGLQSFIIPNNILRATPYEAIRKYLLEKSAINEIVDLGKDVFSDATVSTVIMSHSKFIEKNNIKITKNIIDLVSENCEKAFVPQEFFLKNEQYVLNILVDETDIKIINKIEKQNGKLGDYFKYISPGIDGDKNKYVSDNPINEKYKPLLYGKSFTRYLVRDSNNFILYDRELLNRARSEEIYLSDKIIIQRISGGLMPITGTIDKNQYYTFNSVNNLVPKTEFKEYLEYFMALINSKLINWYYAIKFSNRSNLTVNISKTFLEILPIFITSNQSSLNEIKELVNKILLKNIELQTIANQTINLIESKFEHIKNNRKINNWYELEFKELVVELKKNSINLSLAEEAEWMQYFNEQKVIAKSLKTEIIKTDKEIDKIVYELYGLTETEIKIVEEATA